MRQLVWVGAELLRWLRRPLISTTASSRQAATLGPSISNWAAAKVVLCVFFLNGLLGMGCGAGIQRCLLEDRGALLHSYWNYRCSLPVPSRQRFPTKRLYTLQIFIVGSCWFTPGIPNTFSEETVDPPSLHTSVHRTPSQRAVDPGKAFLWASFGTPKSTSNLSRS